VAPVNYLRKMCTDASFLNCEAGQVGAARTPKPQPEPGGLTSLDLGMRPVQVLLARVGLDVLDLELLVPEARGEGQAARGEGEGEGGDGDAYFRVFLEHSFEGEPAPNFAAPELVKRLRRAVRVRRAGRGRRAESHGWVVGQVAELVDRWRPEGQLSASSFLWSSVTLSTVNSVTARCLRACRRCYRSTGCRWTSASRRQGSRGR
jgi:hypothetical protein